MNITKTAMIAIALGALSACGGGGDEQNNMDANAMGTDPALTDMNMGTDMNAGTDMNLGTDMNAGTDINATTNTDTTTTGTDATGGNTGNTL